MGARVKTEINKIPEIEARTNHIRGRKIIAGVLDGEHAWLARIHEYGLNIEVTDKMRRYLASQGLHLRAETKFIRIPERSFLRSGHDEHIEEVMSKVAGILPDVLSGNVSDDQFLDAIGLLLTSRIKDFAVELKSPPNHWFTVERKGSANPLISTGDMINSITWEVE